MPQPPRPDRRHALLPLGGSLALHGLAAAALAAGGWLWLREVEEPRQPPEFQVEARAQQAQVEFAPPPEHVVEPPPEATAEVVEAAMRVLEPLPPEAQVEMLLPRPPMPFDWRPVEPPAAPPTSPAEPQPEQSAEAAAAAAEAAAAVEAPQVDHLRCPPPEYPRAAWRRGQQGLVEVQVHVDADGAVVEVLLRKSSGHDLLDDAALEAVRGWHFHPARDAAGAAVAGDLVVPVRFRIDDDTGP